MMDWVPVVFVVFKVLVFGVGMFFAIKWHYDQAKKGTAKEMRAVLRTSAMVTTVFVLLAVGLVFGTFAFAKWLGMDLS
jgi:hypothetical protein